MNRPRSLKYFVAFSDHVVLTDDTSSLDIASIATTFHVTTKKALFTFSSTPDGCADTRHMATRWFGEYTPSGVYRVRVWLDHMNRNEDQALDVISFAPGVWHTVNSNVELVLKGDVADDDQGFAQGWPPAMNQS